MITAIISRYGDRKREPAGCTINKIDMNVYRLSLRSETGRPHVFVETKTAHRVAVVDSVPCDPGMDIFDIRTFNILNGYHPGSDLMIRVYRDGDPDLLGVAEIKDDRITNVDALGALKYLDKKSSNRAKITFDAEEQQQVLVQPQGKTFRYAEVKQEGRKVSVETLITRTPATPLETNIEIAIVRNLGPIRGR